MLEIAALIVVTAVVFTFITDAMSDTTKVVRASMRRRSNIRVADPKHSQH